MTALRAAKEQAAKDLLSGGGTPAPAASPRAREIAPLLDLETQLVANQLNEDTPEHLERFIEERARLVKLLVDRQWLFHWEDRNHNGDEASR